MGASKPVGNLLVTRRRRSSLNFSSLVVIKDDLHRIPLPTEIAVAKGVFDPDAGMLVRGTVGSAGRFPSPDRQGI